MSVMVQPSKPVGTGKAMRMFAKGAPEGILDRCSHVRVGTNKVPMTAALKAEIMKIVGSYGTGRDTLRCLGLATIDNPIPKEQMDLEDSTKFIRYEVRWGSSTGWIAITWMGIKWKPMINIKPHIIDYSIEKSFCKISILETNHIFAKID